MFFAQKTSKLIKDLEKDTTIRISKYLLQTISYNVAVSKFGMVELVFFFIYVIVIVDIFKRIMKYNSTSHSFNKFYQHFYVSFCPNQVYLVNNCRKKYND